MRCNRATRTWHCSNEAIVGLKTCAHHAAQNARRQERYRQKRAKLGLCKECDAPASAINSQYCEKHRVRHARRTKRWRLS